MLVQPPAFLHVPARSLWDAGVPQTERAGRLCCPTSGREPRPPTSSGTRISSRRAGSCSLSVDLGCRRRCWPTTTRAARRRAVRRQPPLANRAAFQQGPGRRAPEAVAVSRAAATSSAGAPARPLLKCSVRRQRRPRRTGHRPAPPAVEQRSRQPDRLVALHEPAGFAEIAAPEHVARRRARPVVAHRKSRRVRLHARGVPEVPRRHSGTNIGGWTSVKSARRVGQPSRRTAATPPRGSAVRPWNTIATLSALSGRKRDLLAPVRIEQAARVEVDEALRSAGGRPSSDVALIVALRAAEESSGSSWVRRVSRVTTPKLPPPPPFSAQNRSGLRAGVGDAHLAVGGDDLGLQQARRGECRSALEKLPKPPLWIRPATPTVVQPPPCT